VEAGQQAAGTGQSNLRRVFASGDEVVDRRAIPEEKAAEGGIGVPPGQDLLGDLVGESRQALLTGAGAAECGQASPEPSRPVSVGGGGPFAGFDVTVVRELAAGLLGGRVDTLEQRVYGGGVPGVGHD